MIYNPTSAFARAVTAGEIIAVSATIYLNCPNKIVGSFLFSIGLLTVIQFGLKLYTGWTGIFADYIGTKAGRHAKIEGNDLSLTELSVLLVYILVGNFLGAGIVGALVNLCMPETRNVAVALMQNKEAVSISGMLMKGVLCGCLMQVAFIANAGSRTVEGFLVAILCIMGFILAGFEHSIADIAYAFIAMQWTAKTVVLLIAAVVGNLLGGHFTWLQLDR